MDPSVYRAAESGDYHSSLFIEGQNNDVLRQQTPEKATILHIAVNFKQQVFAKFIISKCPSLLIQPDSKGDTPLHTAAKIGSRVIAELLIDSAKTVPIEHVQNPTISEAPTYDKLRLRMVNLEGDTALHVAVRNGHSDVVKLLIDSDVELVNLINSADESPLYLAIERGFFDIAKCILENCTSYAHGGTNGMTALHAAVIRTHDGRDLGNSFSALYEEEFTIIPLFRFFWRLRGYIMRTPSGSAHIDRNVPELSLEGVRHLFFDLYFHTRKWIFGPPDQSSTSKTSFDIVTLLLKKRTEMVKKADKFMWTPLHYAAHIGHLEATRQLLHFDSSIAYNSDKEHSSALHIAAKKGHINIMKELIKTCPDTYKLLDERGRTALHVAVESGMVKVVKYILKMPNLEGLINEPDKEGNTPLHLAAIYEKYSILKILRDNKKVDKRAMNKKYMKAIDIVQSNMGIGNFRKFWITKKLEADGGVQSLHGLVIRKNTNTQKNDSEGQQGSTHRANDRSLEWSKEVAKQEEIKSNRLKDISKIHLLVGTLIATVTFTAGFTMPGGFKNDGAEEGKAVLATRTAFKAFVITDGAAFYCSTASVFLHFFASLEDNYYLLLRFVKIAALLTYISILGMVMAFTSGIFVVLPSSSVLSIAAFVIGCIFLGFYIVGVL